MVKEYYRTSKRLRSHYLLAYPRVRIIANSAVVDRINNVYREKIDKWKTILGSGATSQVVVYREVFENIQGDTDENTMRFGFLDREFSSLAMSCSITCTSTPQKRTVRLGGNG
jgi:hypothetical protein